MSEAPTVPAAGEYIEAYLKVPLEVHGLTKNPQDLNTTMIIAPKKDHVTVLQG